MTAAKQFIVISYDISNDKRRLKAAKTLEDFGARVQYSVFECRLTPPEFEKLKKRLQPYAREAQDTIRMYFIGSEDVPRIQVMGAGKVTEESPYFIH
ncbi:MAG TPA: CRISPR-associated endonuclease Cas2 [Anaerolineales bacterium]|nr:CRISPR-associated endonuclease Cas2 [Anaerolineales bacterium]